MLSIGDTFIWDGHVWFVLSNPNAEGKSLCVNLTTLDEECIDDECLLETTDYGWIRHTTAVAFSRSKLFDTAKIAHAIEAGQVAASNPARLPDATMLKVKAAALNSVQLSESRKKLL
jgi:hypothetical protein